MKSGPEYVMSVEYPSIDELYNKYKVSKPLMIAKSNDREDAANNGLTWQEQRRSSLSQEKEQVKKILQLLGQKR